MNNHIKIAVVGLGGVGGYIAGVLGKICDNLTVVARGKRMQAIKKNGLVLDSQYSGNIVTHPSVVENARELGEQDIIFICVKNYSLDAACEELQDVVKKDTIIVPVMNGIEPGDKVRKLLGKGIVVDSLIYIVSYAKADYSITQEGDFVKINIGIKSNQISTKEKEAIKKVYEVLNNAKINCNASENIEKEIWLKYILNCAFNVETAYYNNTIGELRKDKEKEREYISLVTEAYKVALKKGISIRQQEIDEIISKFYGYREDATSSLQRDIREGKMSEADVFSGYIVREAEKLGVSVPVSKKMYEKLAGRNSNSI